MGPYQIHKQWVGVFTPTFQVLETSCFMIDVNTWSQMRIYKITDTGEKILKVDTGSDESQVFTTIKIPVHPSSQRFYYMLEWPGIKLYEHGFYVVIHSIKLQPGPCQHEQLLLDKYCGFDKGLCGFDFGKPVGRWMPVLEPSNVNEKGQACPRYMQNHSAQEKLAATLDNPCTHIKSISSVSKTECLTKACDEFASIINFFPEDEQCVGEYCFGECQLGSCPHEISPELNKHKTGADVYFVYQGKFTTSKDTFYYKYATNIMSH